MSEQLFSPHNMDIIDALSSIANKATSSFDLISFCSISTIVYKCYKTITFKPFNSLQNHKFLDWSKLKSPAEDKINMTDYLDWWKTLWEKETMLNTTIFSCFSTILSESFYFRNVKRQHCVIKS